MPDQAVTVHTQLLRPARFVLILSVALRYWSGRSSEGHKRLQSTELLKAAALLRLHESLDPCVAVGDLLLAQICSHLVHRLSRLDSACLGGTATVGLLGDESFDEGPDHLD